MTVVLFYWFGILSIKVSSGVTDGGILFSFKLNLSAKLKSLCSKKALLNSFGHLILLGSACSLTVSVHWLYFYMYPFYCSRIISIEHTLMRYLEKRHGEKVLIGCFWLRACCCVILNFQIHQVVECFFHVLWSLITGMADPCRLSISTTVCESHETIFSKIKKLLFFCLK